MNVAARNFPRFSMPAEPRIRAAICLITADRWACTKKTLESFRDFNPSMPAMLLHADDASEDVRIRSLAKAHGFELVAGTRTGKPRRGGQAMRHDSIREAHKRGATHVIILENDWESVRALPWDAMEYAFSSPDVYCMRLYGVYRERDPLGNGRRACGKTHYGKGKGTYDPNWLPIEGAPEPLQVGDIHWGAPPAVTCIQEALWLHDGTRSEGHIRKKCAKFDLLTARVVDNVFYHIGTDRTPNFTA